MVDWSRTAPGATSSKEDQMRALDHILGGGDVEAPAIPATQPSVTRDAATQPLTRPVRPDMVPARTLPGKAEINADTPWSTVAYEGARNALPSAVNMVGDVVQAVSHPIDTAKGIGSLAYGIGSKAYGAMGFDQDPAEKAKNEAVLDAVVDDYKTKYGDLGGFKNRLANDPFNIGTDVATVATLGGGAMTKLGAVEKASKVARAARLAELADPINLAGKLTGVVANKSSAVARYGWNMYAAVHSGTPKAAYDLASSVAKIPGEEGQVARAAFRDYATGRKTTEELADTAQAAFNEAADLASNNYRAKKSDITAFTDPIPLANTQAAQIELGTYIRRGDPMSGDRAAAVDALDIVTKRMQDPSLQTIDGIDRMKRDLRLRADNVRDPSLKALIYKMADGAKKDIVAVDPEYAKLMDEWQRWIDDAKALKGELGLGNTRVSEAQMMKRLQKGLKDDKKMEVIGLLSQTPSGRNLPYMLAGHELREMMPIWLRGGGLSASIVPAALASLSGPFPAVVAGIPAAIGASPKLGGNISYGAARASEGLKNLGEAAVNATYANNPAVHNVLQNVEDTNDRMGRKSGGRVEDHDALADRLVAAAERAKKELGSETKPILSMPDEAVQHALEVANRSI